MNPWLAGAGILLIITVGLILLLYVRDRQSMRARMAARSEIVQTAVGPIEITSHGEGPVVLAVHGWGGGGSGDYNMFRFLAGHGFRVVSPSRPGYLGTPISAGGTMEAQADALAALLDALGERRAGVITGSGGGPASVLFALRHPDRCWGLVLVSAMTHPDATRVTEGQKTLRVLFKSDFFIWCVAKLFWRQLVEDGMGGLSESIRADAATMADLKSIVHGLILSSDCAAGMDNDWVQWERMPVYPIERVTAPALVIHARNDKTVPFKTAEFNASIPGAKLIAFGDGGHTCYIAHADVTHPATVEFLKGCAPQ